MKRLIVFCLSLLVSSALLAPPSGRASQGRMRRPEAVSNQVINLLSTSMIQDSVLLEQVSSVGYSLMSGDSLEFPYDLRFHVIYAPIPNAFSLPSGDIYVTTGLLDILKNRSELALVLGREISFLEAEAGLRTYKREKNIKTLTDVATVGLFCIVAYYQVKATIKAAEENPMGVSSTPPPTYTLLYYVAGLIPETALSLSRGGRMRKARLSPELMMGRERSGQTFDMFLVATVSEGFAKTLELAADKRAFELAARGGWDPTVQSALLDRLVPVSATGNFHLCSQLGKRIIQADYETERSRQSEDSAK